ncbi:MAG: hypothetical protein KME19_23325 [Microcoleus vaginatus WJT46-NPBG5]|jgi:hypothetical protein|nr:hypothetical protein [Microcoleus vaginatus WJT46-NPBG5]
MHTLSERISGKSHEEFEIAREGGFVKLQTAIPDISFWVDVLLRVAQNV